jgi:hypothetical protein
VQHHGGQALALVRAFATGPLPRPRTGDGVFFDFPGLGLVVYPEWLALPLALAAIVLVVAVLAQVRRVDARWTRGVTVGAAATILSPAVAALAAQFVGRALTMLHAALPWGGAPAWSGVYAFAIILLAAAVAASAYVAARRTASAAAAHAGALVVWALLSLVVALRVPGGSYLFTWPLLFAAGAALLVATTPNRVAGVAARWLATLVAFAFFAAFVYTLSAIMLGVTLGGGAVAALLTALVVWLIAPQIESLGAGARVPALALAGTLLLIVAGALTVRTTAEHPASSQLFYVTRPGDSTAWLATPAGLPNRWAAAIVPTSSERQPPWVRAAAGTIVHAAPAAALPLDGARTLILADSTSGTTRRLKLRVLAPSGTFLLSMRVAEASVLASAIDGRSVDTTRFRRRPAEWGFNYFAPPDDGLLLDLTLAAGAKPVLELAAQRLGVPTIPGHPIPPRPGEVVPLRWGDLTIVYRADPL